MAYYTIKLIVSALLIVLISEVSKKYAMLGGLLASLPLVSYLAMVWLYVDTHDNQKVAQLSMHVFWLVLPSLPLFVVLAWLLRSKLPFLVSLMMATFVMFICYLVTVFILSRFGVET